jgi:hypothetical protein
VSHYEPDPRDVLWMEQVFQLRCVICGHLRMAGWRLPEAWRVHLDSSGVAATCSDRCRAQCLDMPRVRQEVAPGGMRPAGNAEEVQ